MQARVLIEGVNFAEGLRWRDGRFWYSDFYQHKVLSFGADAVPRIEAEIDDQPSGLGWLPDGRLLMVAMLGRKLLRREHDGRIVEHADLSGLIPDANDMVVDSEGRAYVGSIGFDLDAYVERHGFEGLFGDPGPPTAPIVMVETSGAARVVADGLKFPNGMAIVGDRLIVAQSLGFGLVAFDRTADGSLAGRRDWASFPPANGIVAPDGIYADGEGGVWIANATAPEVIRVAEGGRILDRVATSQIAFSCALGGADNRDLLIATAPTPNTDALKAQPTGRLEMARVPAPRGA